VTRSLWCVRLDVHETIVVHNRCGVACCQSMFTSSRMTSGTPAGRYCPGTVSAQRGSTPHPEPGHADWLGASLGSAGSPVLAVSLSGMGPRDQRGFAS
jgi:hypothetical protein